MPRSRSTPSPEVGIEPGGLVLPKGSGQLVADSVLAEGPNGQGDGVADGGVQLGRQPLLLLVGRDVDPLVLCMHISIPLTYRDSREGVES
jgi:hypothetical protein